MFCSLLLASWLCLQQPIDCRLTIYETQKDSQVSVFTAYTLSADETDANPTIGAGNHNLKEYQDSGKTACASRNLPFHTKIYIDGFGECEVLDRTSAKYSGRVDILFKTKGEAIKFGKKTLRYIIIK